MDKENYDDIIVDDFSMISKEVAEKKAEKSDEDGNNRNNRQ